MVLSFILIAVTVSLEKELQDAYVNTSLKSVNQSFKKIKTLLTSVIPM